MERGEGIPCFLARAGFAALQASERNFTAVYAGKYTGTVIAFRHALTINTLSAIAARCTVINQIVAVVIETIADFGDRVALPRLECCDPCKQAVIHLKGNRALSCRSCKPGITYLPFFTL
jgi:hypothetical protein